MNRRYFIVLLLALASCSKDQVSPQEEIASCPNPCDCVAGTYFGQYEIDSPNNSNVMDSVEIIFTDSTFVSPTFPAADPSAPYICQGSYTCTGDSMFALNGCAFPANITEGQFFSGAFQLEVTQDSLFLERIIGTYPTNYLRYRYSLARH